jgi:hypothetical protein
MNYNRMISMWDAQAAVGFVISQASHIETEVNRTVYPETQWQQLIPIDPSAPEFVKTVTYFSVDSAGKAKWINGNADDVPKAESERSMFETSVHTAGIGYGYGWEEINYAQAVGVPLESERVAAARRGYMEFMDDVGLFGSSEKGGTGLLNHSAITPAGAPNGDWGGTGSSETTMLEDINDVLFAGPTFSKFTMYPDHLLLPYGKAQYLAGTRLGDTSETILDFVRRNNAVTAMTGQPLTIRGVRGLETAGAGDTTRMIAYRKSSQVLKMHVPMLHRFLMPYSPGPLRVDVPGVFRTAPGVDIRQPAGVTYRDGI